MDNEQYFAKKRAEYKEFILDKINTRSGQFGDFGDLETRSMYLISMQPLYFNPSEFQEGFYDAVRGQDWQSVNDYLYQEMCYWLIPCSDGGGGYDHCFRFYQALEAFACGAERVLEQVYPLELGLTENGYRFYVAGSNLVIAQYYHDEELLKQALETANKFIGSRASKWERYAIAFLLNLINKELEAANDNLLNVCKGYGRVEKPMLAAEDVCIPAHGLYCIAKSWLTAEEFAKLTMPKHKAFLQEYAQWRLENAAPTLKPYMVYPKDMDIFNRIYAMPTAKTILTQERFTERAKLQPVIDCRKMHGIFVDALRNGAEGEQH